MSLAAFVPIERRVKAPMVDFTFFRSRSFLGANIVGFIVSFAMLAQFFFLALYMQNFLHFSPLQAGIRFLPSTLVIIVMGPIAGRLTDRIGPRPLITAGLLVVASALFIQSRLTVHTGYGLLLPGFVLMGFGMGLVMSPMTTAAMNAIDRTKAGVASGVLSMSRMVGGTFGVAVMGALVTTIGRANLDSSLPHVPAATRGALANALGSGAVPTGHATSPAIVEAVRHAFVSALSTGLTIGGVITVIGAIAAVTLIQRSPTRAETPSAEADSAPSPAEAEREPTLV
jgi:MFS family permease